MSFKHFFLFCRNKKIVVGNFYFGFLPVFVVVILFCGTIVG